RSSTLPHLLAAREPDGTADGLSPETTGADARDSRAIPRRGRRPTGPKTNSSAIPHRITPPRSQTVADLSRQRAREPKASPPGHAGARPLGLSGLRPTASAASF